MDNWSVEIDKNGRTTELLCIGRNNKASFCFLMDELNIVFFWELTSTYFMKVVKLADTKEHE